MLLPIVIISIVVVSLTLFVATAIFWFPLWIKKKSGTAHGLFLTNAAMAIAIAFKLLQISTDLIANGKCEGTYNLSSAILILMVAVFQFSLSRGYFNRKE